MAKIVRANQALITFTATVDDVKGKIVQLGELFEKEIHYHVKAMTEQGLFEDLACAICGRPLLISREVAESPEAKRGLITFDTLCSAECRDVQRAADLLVELMPEAGEADIADEIEIRARYWGEMVVGPPKNYSVMSMDPPTWDFKSLPEGSSAKLEGDMFTPEVEGTYVVKADPLCPPGKAYLIGVDLAKK